MLAFLAVSMFVISCGKDESKNESLEGTWRLESIEGKEKLDDCQKKSKVSFIDGAYSDTLFGEMSEGGDCSYVRWSDPNIKYKVSGNKIILIIEGKEVDDTIEFSIKGNKLTLIEGGRKLIYVKQ